MDRPLGNTTDVYAECEKWYTPPPLPSAPGIEAKLS